MSDDGSLSDPFPGAWYADADRPSSPAAWKIGRACAIDAVRIRSPRPLHPVAADFLYAYDRLGYLDAIGGAQGVVDASEAAHWLTEMLDGLTRLLEMAKE
jgi:hypothetical protein